MLTIDGVEHAANQQFALGPLHQPRDPASAARNVRLEVGVNAAVVVETCEVGAALAIDDAEAAAHEHLAVRLCRQTIHRAVGLGAKGPVPGIDDGEDLVGHWNAVAGDGVTAAVLHVQRRGDQDAAHLRRGESGLGGPDQRGDRGGVGRGSG